MTRLRRLFDSGHGGAQFAESVAGSLREGRSVVLTVAGDRAAALVSQGIRECLGQSWIDCLGLAAREVPGLIPLQALVREFRLETCDQMVVDFEDRVRKTWGIPQVVELTDYRLMPDTERREWLAFVKEWSRVARPREDGSPPQPSFLIIQEARNADETVSSLPSLLIEELWGFATASDRQYLVDAAIDEQHDEGPLRRAWRRHLLPPLLVGDTALVDTLWDCLESFSDLLAGLSAVAEERGWLEGETRVWVSDLLGAQGRPLPLPGPARDRLRLPWMSGGLEAGPEDGIQISSAALALAGAHAEVRHRYWTGQIRLVMPELDRIRLRLCRELTDAFGERWLPAPNGNGDAPGKERSLEPLDQEFREIHTALFKVHELKRFRQLTAAVENLRWTRNQLAHYQPVTLSHYRQLHDRVEKGWAELRRG